MSYQGDQSNEYNGELPVVDIVVVVKLGYFVLTG